MDFLQERDVTSLEELPMRENLSVWIWFKQMFQSTLTVQKDQSIVKKNTITMLPNQSVLASI